MDVLGFAAIVVTLLALLGFVLDINYETARRERFDLPERTWNIEKPVEHIQLTFRNWLHCRHNYPRMNRADHKYYPGDYTRDQCSNCGQWHRVGSRTMSVILAENRRAR